MNFDNVSAIGDNATHALDISKLAAPGALTNIAYVSGKYGLAANFTGNSQVVINSTSNITNGGPFTVVAWINPTKYDSYDPIASSDGFAFERKSPEGGIALWLSTAAYTAIDPPLNTWTFVAGTYNGTHIYMYYNGVRSGSAVSESGQYKITSVSIGHSSAGVEAGRWWDGKIDEFMLWNRSLSDTEIQELYFTNLYKFNQTQWHLYVNQSKNSSNGLSLGNYTYQAYATDRNSNTNSTEQWTISISTADITAPTWNETPANRTLEYSIDALYTRFNASDLSGISKYFINDTVRFNISGEGIFTNKTLLAIGTYVINVSVNDTSNNINTTYFQIIVSDTLEPNIGFVSPTPANGSSQTGTSIFVNLTSSDINEHYSFVDFNRSLVLWMRMDDRNSSGDPTDLSSYSNNGSAMNGVVFNSTAKFGNASHFD